MHMHMCMCTCACAHVHICDTLYVRIAHVTQRCAALYRIYVQGRTLALPTYRYATTHTVRERRRRWTR